MFRLVKLLLGLPIAILAVMFAVANRQTADLSLWPLPFEITLPVFLLVLAPLALGILVGGLAAWLGGGKSRQLARERGRQIKAMEKAQPAVSTLPALSGH